MLKGKSAVITGSTSGIGLAFAEALARHGANVTMNGLGTEKENSDAIERVASHGTEVKFHPANMLKPEEIADLIKSSETSFGGVDVLINNAGIQHVAPIDEFPIAKWDAIIAINLTAAFHAIHHALPGMKKRRWGRIMNTASIHSTVASPFKSAYVTAKHGIAGLTKTVALEVAELGITVNAISPGYVLTPLVEDQLEDSAKTRRMKVEDVKSRIMLANQPTKEFVTVEQVAALAVFLCSDGAASITGAQPAGRRGLDRAVAAGHTIVEQKTGRDAYCDRSSADWLRW